MNSRQKTIFYASIVSTVFSFLGAVLMVRKFTDGVDLLFNPVVYLIAFTQLIGFFYLIANFRLIATKPSVIIIHRGMIVLLVSGMTAGVGFSGLYLINDYMVMAIAMSVMVFGFVFMVVATTIKYDRIKNEQFYILNNISSERKVHDFFDEQFSVMHNLPPLLSVIVIVLALVGYNTLRAFPTFSGICLLFSFGFLSLICYQFAFASWLVSKKLKTLSEKKE